MGLRKPVIVNNSGGGSVDLSGIESTLASIQEDVAAAKTAAGEAKTAAQAAESAAGEGASIQTTIATGGTTASTTNTLSTIADISGKGRATVVVYNNGNPFVPKLTIDGQLSDTMNGENVSVAAWASEHYMPLTGVASSHGLHEISFDFSEGFKFELKSNSTNTSNAVYCHIFYQLY